MKPRSLLAQVLAVNLLLVAATVLVATIAVDARTTTVTRGREMLVFGLAMVATLLGNWLLLRRRFAPLDQMISAMERLDLADPGPPAPPPQPDSAEVHAAGRGLSADDRPARGRAPAGRPRGDPGPGARAAADRPGSPRRGQPGADRGVAAAAGLDRARAARAAPRAHRDQAAVRPGDGGAACPRPPASTRGARRPRADSRAAQPGARLRRSDRGSTPSSTRAARCRG